MLKGGRVRTEGVCRLTAMQERYDVDAAESDAIRIGLRGSFA